MTIEQPETAPKRPRWLYAALIASVGLNLLVAGGAASAFWKHRHHGPRGEAGLMGFVRQLPESKRAELGSYVESEREKLKPLQEAVRAGWSETNTILVEDPFDKEKLKAAMSRMNDAEMRRRSAISDTLVEAAAKLSADERKALKEWRERTHKRGRKGWRHHDRDER